MSSLFGGGGGGASYIGTPTGTGDSASRTTALPKPKVVRMPTDSDPSILAAAQRTRKAAMQRSGRLSTIMTDNLSGTDIGSSGRALGA